MNEPKPILMHRSDLLSNLNAIAYTQQRMKRLATGDYAKGYNEGYEDCLAAIVLMVRGDNESLQHSR